MKTKAESEQTEETSETKVDTRRSKKVDTYSNNKTRTRNRLCYPTSPRATDAERAITRKFTSPEVTSETLADTKGKTWDHR